jgi:esterase/lipase superfamily enzyme
MGLRPSVCLIVAVAVASPARAASFRDLKLVLDGSSAPPGDVLELSVLFYPDDAALTLEVRAYQIVDVPAADPAAPPARETLPVRGFRDLRDPEGRFVKRVTLPRPQGDVESSVRIIIPFAALDLPLGEHRVGYEVVARRGADVQFSAATEVTFMTLTDAPRTQMRVPVIRRTSGIRRQTRTILVADPAQPQGFREETVQVPIEDFTDTETFEQVDVMIPRGYARFRRQVAAFTNAEDPLAAQLTDLQLRGAAYVWRQKEPVLFATNRNIADAAAAGLARFGDTIGPVTYGSCLVNFPHEHEPGERAQPRWWERPDPDRHFLVDAVNVLELPAIQALLRGALGERRQDVLLLVHGYSNTIEFAVLRLAQVKMDMHFPGPAMLFAWPSRGKSGLLAYEADVRTADASVSALKSVLRMLADQHAAGAGPDRKVHLVAHSMGNRILVAALAQLSRDLPATARPFGSVVLAAPDVDFKMMTDLFPQAGQNADSVTLYYSADDRALEFSHRFNNDTRIGQTALFEDGLLNIDALHANTSILGHDYFASSSRLLADLELALNLRLPPSRRPQTLRERTDGLGNREWYFPAVMR